MEKRSKRKRRLGARHSEDGTTMVEVLVAFAVLILIMGIFSQAMGLAGRMLQRSDDTLENYRELAGDYYLERRAPEDREAVTMTFKRLSGSVEEFSVTVDIRTYEKPDCGKLSEVVYETTAAGDGT